MMKTGNMCNSNSLGGMVQTVRGEYKTEIVIKICWLKASKNNSGKRKKLKNGHVFFFFQLVYSS